MSLAAPFLRSVLVLQERIQDPNVYPFALPAVRALNGLKLSAVTYFIGENGSGKSTVLKAIAVA
jgi:predicted ATPase